MPSNIESGCRMESDEHVLLKYISRSSIVLSSSSNDRLTIFCRSPVKQSDMTLTANQYENAWDSNFLIESCDRNLWASVAQTRSDRPRDRIEGNRSIRRNELRQIVQASEQSIHQTCQQLLHLSLSNPTHKCCSGSSIFSFNSGDLFSAPSRSSTEEQQLGEPSFSHPYHVQLTEGVSHCLLSISLQPTLPLFVFYRSRFVATLTNEDHRTPPIHRITNTHANIRTHNDKHDETQAHKHKWTKTSTH